MADSGLKPTGSKPTGSKPTVVVASNNPDKVADLLALIGDRFEVVARPPEAPETDEDQDSLEGNAIKKAQEICDFTGLAALADDTGLFVEALDGRPGVYSARYAGENASYADNVAKLLSELDEVGATEPEQRRAEFRSVIALIRPDGTGLTAEGSIGGVIVSEARGANGFGYDPVFRPDEAEGATFAELSAEDKNDLSHRARAMTALRLALEHEAG